MPSCRATWPWADRSTIERLLDARFIGFTTRAPSSDAFAPGRDSGIMWSRNFAEDEKMWWGIGTFFNTDQIGQASGQGQAQFRSRRGQTPKNRRHTQRLVAT